MQTKRKARHSATKSAAAAAGKTRPTRKSKVAARKAARPALTKAKDAVTEVGEKAVEVAKTLAHKGEELVSKVFGSKESGRKGGAKKKTPGRSAR